jgi:hypothetical protein
MSFRQLQERAGLSDKQLGMLLPNCTYKVINSYQAGATVPKSVIDTLNDFIAQRD